MRRSGPLLGDVLFGELEHKAASGTPELDNRLWAESFRVRARSAQDRAPVTRLRRCSSRSISGGSRPVSRARALQRLRWTRAHCLVSFSSRRRTLHERCCQKRSDEDGRRDHGRVARDTEHLVRSADAAPTPRPFCARCADRRLVAGGRAACDRSQAAFVGAHRSADRTSRGRGAVAAQRARSTAPPNRGCGLLANSRGRRARGSPVTGIAGVDLLLADLVRYVPRILDSILVLLLGFAVRSGLAGDAARRGQRPGPFGQVLGTGLRVLVLVATAAIALDQLGIGSGVVHTAFAIAFGAVMLAFAIAFGLGGRHAARRFIEQRLLAPASPTTTRADPISDPKLRLLRWA